MIGRGELQKLLGISSSTIDNLLKVGLPHERAKNRLQFDPELVKEWYAARNENNHKIGTEGYQESRARKEAALASLAEIELAQKQKTVISVEEVLKHIEAEYVRVKARLLGLPSKLSGEILGMQTQIEISEILDQGIRSALAELSEPDEVLR